MKRRGLGILEVLIALACLVVVAAAIILSTLTGRATWYRSENRSVARYLALEAVELLRGLPFRDVMAAARAKPAGPLAGVLPVSDDAATPKPEWKLSEKPITGAAGDMTYGQLLGEENFPDFYRKVSLQIPPELGTAKRPLPAVRAEVTVCWWELGQDGVAAAQRELTAVSVIVDRESAP